MIVPFRAGKTSIQQVLFKNLPPKETFYLETTMRIIKHQIEFVFRTVFSLISILTILLSTVIPLEVWDCPGNTTVASLGVSLSQFATIIFVIDIRVSSSSPAPTSGVSLNRQFRTCIISRFQNLLKLLLLHMQKILKLVSRSSSTKLKNCRRTTRSVCQSTII